MGNGNDIRVISRDAISDSIKPLPQVSIEKVEFLDNSIVAYIRNTGPSEITIAQADVNDRIYPGEIEPGRTLSRLADARVTIPFIECRRAVRYWNNYGLWN